MSEAEAEKAFVTQRFTELRKLPPEAELQANFEFAGPMEPEPVRRETLAKLDSIQNSTPQLIQLLQGEKRLDADSS
jgi:hypothetical protein